jgi:hypothetical protein
MHIPRHHSAEFGNLESQPAFLTKSEISDVKKRPHWLPLNQMDATNASGI